MDCRPVVDIIHPASHQEQETANKHHAKLAWTAPIAQKWTNLVKRIRWRRWDGKTRPAIGAIGAVLAKGILGALAAIITFIITGARFQIADACVLADTVAARALWRRRWRLLKPRSAVGTVGAIGTKSECGAHATIVTIAV